jgi:hypothetical protein
MLTKDKKNETRAFQRGWTDNILFTQKKRKEMADLLFVWQKDTGNYL